MTNSTRPVTPVALARIYLNLADRRRLFLPSALLMAVGAQLLAPFVLVNLALPTFL
jgi:hypothetical protein